MWCGNHKLRQGFKGCIPRGRRVLLKGMIFILNLNPKSSIRRVGRLTWYQSLVWQEVLSLSHLFAIYSPFVDLKVHVGLCLVCLTLHVWV